MTHEAGLGGPDRSSWESLPGPQSRVGALASSPRLREAISFPVGLYRRAEGQRQLVTTVVMWMVSGVFVSTVPAFQSPEDPSWSRSLGARASEQQMCPRADGEKRAAQ